MAIDTLSKWASLDESEDTDFSRGYEAARSYVAMQLRSAPTGSGNILYIRCGVPIELCGHEVALVPIDALQPNAK